MEKSCLTQIKAILKSLVLSCTDKMTIEKLNRDYRDIEGEAIPYRRLGYTSIDEFLRAIPDTLRVFGSGPTAVVCFVANEKSDHIHDMIMQQRKPKAPARHRNRARSKPRPSANNRFHNNNQPFRKTSAQQLSPFQNVNRRHVVKTVNVWNNPPPLTSALPQPSGIVLPNNTNIQTIPANNLKKYNEHVKQVSNLLKANCFITQPPPPPLPVSKATNSGIDIKETPPIKETKTVTCSEVKESRDESKTNTSTKSVNVNNLLENIKLPKPKDKSQPIKLSRDLERLMTMRRNVKFLNPNKNDSSSDSTLVEVVTEPDKILDGKLNKKDVNILFDINNEEESEKEEAVPSFAAKSNVFRLDFPEYSVSFGNKIAPYQIPNDLKVGSCIKIFISEIHSPFKFWLHIHKEEHELDLLMFQLDNYYATLGVADLRIPLTSLLPGQVCAACFNGMWHRAEIVAPPLNSTVKVSFMDYGTVTEVKIEEIKFLSSYFAQLPAQALRGCLSHIKPRQRHWSHEATLHFLKLSSDLMLYAKITEIDTENQILYMILCNTYADNIVQINKSLVEHRYALYSEEWKTEKIQKNNGKRVHHPREDFPTFAMIESGEYPNFTQLFNLQRRGIDYEAMYDAILYNQSCILNKHENVPEFIRKLPYFLTTTNPFRSDIILESHATTSNVM